MKFTEKGSEPVRLDRVVKGQTFLVLDKPELGICFPLWELQGTMSISPNCNDLAVFSLEKAQIGILKNNTSVCITRIEEVIFKKDHKYV